MRNTLLLLVLALLSTTIIRAQATSESMAFSLQQAMDYATENAFQSKSATYDIEAAEKRVWEYIAIGLPQVSADGRFTDNIEIPTVIFDGQEFQMGQKYEWNMGGSVNQLLFDGTYLLGIKASRIYVAISEKNKTKTQIDVRQSVAEAYYVALIAKRNLETFQKNLEVNEQTLKETDAYFKNGFREMTDVDQLKLMVNNSRNLVLDAERQLLISEAVLKFSMGLSIDQPILLTDDIEFLLTPVEAYIPQSSSFNVTSHIDYSILQTQEEAQKALIKSEQVQYLPKLNAFGNYNYQRMGPELNNTVKITSSAIGLTLSMPIFKSGMQSARVKQEKINYLKLQNEMLQMEEGLKQQLMVAESNFKNAQATYLNDKEGEAIAFRIYDRTRIKFTKGLSSSVELSQNEGQYIQTQISFIQSTLNLLDSHIKYKKAINEL